MAKKIPLFQSSVSTTVNDSAENISNDFANLYLNFAKLNKMLSNQQSELSVYLQRKQELSQQISDAEQLTNSLTHSFNESQQLIEKRKEFDLIAKQILSLPATEHLLKSLQSLNEKREGIAKKEIELNEKLNYWKQKRNDLFKIVNDLSIEIKNNFE